MSKPTDVDFYPVSMNGKGLYVFDAKDKINMSPYMWISGNKDFLENMLLKQGGVLLRNFNIHSLSEFNEIIKLFSSELLDYVYRSTPRTKLGGKVYTATEYPPERWIPLHNENSYSKSWPEKIFFYSAIVASKGGNTPLADSRSVFKNIDPYIKDKFMRHGVTYIRNYTKEFDLSWQEVFQTEDKEAVERYCIDNEIEFFWKSGICELTTKQKCQSVHIHPKTGEHVWFNQAHLFHISSLDKDTRVAIVNELGMENMPRNATYGNGEEIDEDVLSHIRDVYEQERITFQWQRGDILILDNVLMAHGREPFAGERKVAVAMANGF